MLRSAIDWASTKSSKLLSRYFMMDSECDNRMNPDYRHYYKQPIRRHSCEIHRTIPEKLIPEPRDEPQQFIPVKRRQRARRNQSSNDIPSSDLTAQNDIFPTKLEKEDKRLRISFHRHVRYPLDNLKGLLDDDDFADKETYAQILRKPKDLNRKAEQEKEFEQSTEQLLKKMDRWKNDYGIFSLSVLIDCGVATKLDSSKKVLFSKEDKAVLRFLCSKMRQQFGDIVRIKETHLGTNRKLMESIYIGPSSKFIESQLSADLKMMEDERKIVFDFEPSNNVPPKAASWNRLEEKINVDEDFSTQLEEMFWTKQERYTKRKLGKINKKKLRTPLAPPVETPKKESMVKLESKIHKSRGAKKEQRRNVAKNKKGKRKVLTHTQSCSV